MNIPSDPPPPLPRSLEPEVMDDAAEAIAYDAMDHREVNQRFVDDLLAGGPVGTQVVDLGTGTARIPILLCQQRPEIRVLALDAATSMLDLAATLIDVGGVMDQIQLQHADAKDLAAFDDEICDCVISNTLLHHVAEPQRVLDHALRLLRSGGRLFIRDLMRPASGKEVDRLTELHAGGEPPAARQLLHQSLHAALTLDEIRDLLARFGLPPTAVTPTSDRHWTIDVRK